MRLAEAGIPCAPEQLIDRPAVAIAGIQIAQRVERQAERVDLSMREILRVRAVGLHPVSIAGVHRDRLFVLPLHGRVIGIAVTGVDPAVEAPGEGIGHAVGIAMAEHAVEDLARIGAAVAIGITQQEDVGNAMYQGRGCGGQGEQADRDVQAIGKGLDRAGPSIGAEP